MTYRVGIDVGGTFTDLALFDEATGEVVVTKAPSTPHAPSEGFNAVIARAGVDNALIRDLVHGTTVGTNALLERKRQLPGLITTRGFRDVVFIQRMNRKHHYDLQWDKPQPYVERRHALEVDERCDYRGEVLEPLDEEQVREAVRALRADGISDIAVCFLFSYLNPAHEVRARELIREEHPEARVSLSHEVFPRWREYDRMSTTLADAFLKTLVQTYVADVAQGLAPIGVDANFLIMKSNGGLVDHRAAAEKPVDLMVSGPVGGVLSALFFGRLVGRRNLISMDMGGTSFDVSLIADGEAGRTTEYEIEWGLPVYTPMIDVRTIGAGGGSVAWVDKGGLLRVGPRSAGAQPGPACYGRGGELPTTTDANVVLGYLDPQYFAGGRMKLDAEAARRAIEQHIAKPMGLSIERAAAGMYRVACNNMAQGVREVTIKRGFDPREFPLIPGGGAGPIHGCLICSELNIPLQIVPREASVLCAFGMLMGELKHDHVRTFVARLASVDWGRLAAMVGSMLEEGARELAEERVPEAARRYELRLDCRYLKQYHEVSVVVPLDAIDRRDAETIARAFHAEHKRLYGYTLEAEASPVEIINVRLQAIGSTERPAYPREAKGSADAAAALKGRRSMYVPERDAFAEVPVYDGERLRHGHRVAGPALVELPTTAIFASDGYDLVVDSLGSFVLYAKGREDLVAAALA